MKSEAHGTLPAVSQALVCGTTCAPHLPPQRAGSVSGAGWPLANVRENSYRVAMDSDPFLLDS